MKKSEKCCRRKRLWPGSAQRRAFVLGLLCIGTAAPSSAELIEADDARFGQGSITRDLAAGLDWLDLTLTIDRSYADVNSELVEFGEFAGFRHATGDEIAGLFENAGVRGADDYARGIELQRRIGVTSPGTSTTTSAGLYDDSATGHEPDFVGRASLLTGTVMVGAPPVPRAFAGTVIEDDATPIFESEGLSSHGHWLVRPTPPIASIEQRDDAVFGPGSITLDTNTGFEWLDVTISADRSFDDVSGQFGAGGDFDGFRHATRGEIAALFENAGVRGAADYNAGVALQNLLGVTTPGNPTVLTTGLYDDFGTGLEASFVGNATLATGTVMVGNPPVPRPFAGTILEDDATPSDQTEGLSTHGHWLVRGCAWCIAGDTNADGIVDIDDLNDVRNFFGATGRANGTLAGDAFPYDGVVNIEDLNAIRNNFGAARLSAPEPPALLLALAAIAIGWTTSRPRCRLGFRPF
jgi:hypothetical protein